MVTNPVERDAKLWLKFYAQEYGQEQFSHDSKTALMLACDAECWEPVAASLLKARADVHAKDGNGDTAMSDSCEDTQPRMYAWSPKRGVKPLPWAVDNLDGGAVSVLLKKKVCLEGGTHSKHDRETGLMLAADMGCWELVVTLRNALVREIRDRQSLEVLMKCKADANTSSREPPLHEALAVKDAEAVTLLSYKADASKLDSQAGTLALTATVQKRRVALCQSLIAVGQAVPDALKQSQVVAVKRDQDQLELRNNAMCGCIVTVLPNGKDSMQIVKPAMKGIDTGFMKMLRVIHHANQHPQQQSGQTATNNFANHLQAAGLPTRKHTRVGTKSEMLSPTGFSLFNQLRSIWHLSSVIAPGSH